MDEYIMHRSGGLVSARRYTSDPFMYRMLTLRSSTPTMTWTGSASSIRPAVAAASASSSSRLHRRSPLGLATTSGWSWASAARKQALQTRRLRCSASERTVRTRRSRPAVSAGAMASDTVERRRRAPNGFDGSPTGFAQTRSRGGPTRRISQSRVSRQGWLAVFLTSREPPIRPRSAMRKKTPPRRIDPAPPERGNPPPSERTRHNRGVVRGHRRSNDRPRRRSRERQEAGFATSETVVFR